MLKRVLLANAVSCLVFGALFAVFPTATANFLGTPPAWLVLVLGIGLVLNGLNLIRVARKNAPSPIEVMQFVVGDALWVVATLVLIGTGLWITTPHGVWASLAVALWVAACGLGQYACRPIGRPA